MAPSCLFSRFLTPGGLLLTFLSAAFAVASWLRPGVGIPWSLRPPPPHPCGYRAVGEGSWLHTSIVPAHGALAHSWQVLQALSSGVCGFLWHQVEGLVVAQQLCGAPGVVQTRVPGGADPRGSPCAALAADQISSFWEGVGLLLGQGGLGATCQLRAGVPRLQHLQKPGLRLRPWDPLQAAGSPP